MGREENKHRGKWASHWDYLLSLAGYAIGLGNVWRFPYLCFKNGGGAFLIPYLVMLVVVGLPLFLLESSVGQFSSSGSISLYNVCPMFKGIGYAAAIVNLIASTYYSVLVAYPLVFLYYSMTTQLPWTSCDNNWNTDRCIKVYSPHETMSNQTVKIAFYPANEFFNNKILQISEGFDEPDGYLWYLVLADFIVWAVVFLCIFKGVKILGKVVWFTATFPFLMLLVLFLRGVTLPGAAEGIMFYVYPDFSKLLNLSVWADAAVQIFFSLGTGWGTLVTMGSFNAFGHNCVRDALLIPVVNCATSFFAGFVVFSVIGFLAGQMQMPVAEVTASGPALAFMVYPEALALLPMAPFWSALFFLMLFFLGIDSIFVQVEAMVVSIADEHPTLQDKRVWISLASCVIMFLGALACCTRGGIYVLQLLDVYSVPVPITVAALMEVIIFAYIYGGGKVVRDVQMMTSRLVSPFWYLAWVSVTPLVLLFILFNVDYIGPIRYRNYVFPSWAESVGLLLAVIPLLAIPAYVIYYLLTAEGNLPKRIRSGLSPSPSWGPAPEDLRRAWIEYSEGHPLQDPLLHPAFEDRRRRRMQPPQPPGEADSVPLDGLGGEEAGEA